MICYNSCDNINKIPCVVALGNFDGVHKGHMHLLEKAREYAKNNGLSFGIYTFDVHPRVVGNDKSFRLLSDNRQRIRMFEECGADFVCFEDFESVKNFDKESFAKYLCEKLCAEAVFCGENFRYAKGASGNSATLSEDMRKHGKKAFVVELLKVDGENVCSSRIRELIEDGRVEEAALLLGHNFCIEGDVIHGNSIGRRIGFPTVNIKPVSELVCPMFGVYASRVYVDGKAYNGITNFGVKPTVNSDNKEILAETNVFGFDGDVYGKRIQVCLCKMLRSEKKFSSFDDLKRAIDNDVKEAKKYFGEDVI